MLGDTISSPHGPNGMGRRLRPFHGCPRNRSGQQGQPFCLQSLRQLGPGLRKPAKAILDYRNGHKSISNDQMHSEGTGNMKLPVTNIVEAQALVRSVLRELNVL